MKIHILRLVNHGHLDIDLLLDLIITWLFLTCSIIFVTSFLKVILIISLCTPSFVPDPNTNICKLYRILIEIWIRTLFVDYLLIKWKQKHQLYGIFYLKQNAFGKYVIQKVECTWSRVLRAGVCSLGIKQTRRRTLYLVSPLDDQYDVFVDWEFFSMCTDLIRCAGTGHLTVDVFWKKIGIWMGQLKVKVKHAPVTHKMLSNISKIICWFGLDCVKLLGYSGRRPDSITQSKPNQHMVLLHSAQHFLSDGGMNHLKF